MSAALTPTETTADARPGHARRAGPRRAAPDASRTSRSTSRSLTGVLRRRTRLGPRGRRRDVRHRRAARRSASSASPARARRRSAGRSCASTQPLAGSIYARRRRPAGAQGRRPAASGAGSSRWSSRTRTRASTRARPSARSWPSRCASTTSPRARPASARVAELLDLVGLDTVVRRALPARVQRRPAPAHRDRPGARRRARAHRLRRADQRARRVDPGAGHQPARAAPGATSG